MYLFGPMGLLPLAALAKIDRGFLVSGREWNWVRNSVVPTTLGLTSESENLEQNKGPKITSNLVPIPLSPNIILSIAIVILPQSGSAFSYAIVSLKELEI
jgi:hypothetical protein